MISSNTLLAFYDPKKPTFVCADASSYEIGGVLMQGQSDQLRPVGLCSRMLTETEDKYAQIDKGCLAAVWTCKRLSCYLPGLLDRSQTSGAPHVNFRKISVRKTI